MAMGPRLEFRQSQSLVMTPQLLQAIKLLQLSTVELAHYVEAELERNPLLERVDGEAGEALPGEADYGDGGYYGSETPLNGSAEMAGADSSDGVDWAGDTLATDRASIERDLGTELENAFPDEATPVVSRLSASEGPTLPSLDGSQRSAKGAAPDDEDPNLEAYLSSGLSLHEHLERQAFAVLATAGDRMIANALIDAIDDTGYLTEPIAGIAERLGAEPADVESVLGVIQACEPVGVGARDLAECLALQLADRDRLDPAMQALVANLHLLARRDFQALKRLCRVDDEDLAEMVAEIRRLDPKPGLIFGAESAQAIVPDVFVRALPDGSWAIELNGDALPQVIANRAYYTVVSAQAKDSAGKSFVDEAWATANWLTRSLEQRARTILKVATEIVRQQDGFLAYGVTHLRPLNLKTIADAVALHESTVSRVTSSKFMATPRGLFEMKYFFTAAIGATGGGAQHSAEAVRYRIKQLIDEEPLDSVLSDDAIVEALRGQGIDIARRTVAKYREAMRIPSSAARRREKKAMAAR
jgi:RNA polymerase sigma-54 factor